MLLPALFSLAVAVGPFDDEASLGSRAVSAQAVAPSASPCPIASPVSSPSATPVPCLKTIVHVVTIGRKANLVGKANSASTGTIDQEQIATRPLLRPGEVLEDIPGVVISQHSGGGKANQYYLRGFQLDHGTDLAAEIDGIPVNLGTHAHGQGYSDINYLMPEMVSYVEFEKGTYFADQGDFATAGGYRLFFRNTLPQTSSLTIGDFGYDRLFTGNSFQAGAGTLLYGIEIAHDNGSYVKPDEYHRLNALLRYSRRSGPNDFAITALGYNGAFDSTDQVPQRLVSAGLLSPYGFIDPTDGGNTNRLALSAHFTHTDPNGSQLKVNAYGVYSFLDLFSNFTYYFFDANDYYNITANPVDCNPSYTTCNPNTGSAPRTNAYQSYCPANNSAPAGAPAHSVVPAPYSFGCGDQREQLDRRVYYGADVTKSFATPATRTTFGVGVRNDNIPEVGLFLGADRNRFPNGTLSDDHAVTTYAYAYIESEIHATPKLRLTPAIRLDTADDVDNAFFSQNSGRASQAVIDPKIAVAYAPDRHDEFYLDFGESYHSNDARGVVGHDDPQTHAPFDPTGAPVYFNQPLTRASGEEAGYRLSTGRLTTTFSAYRLLLANELDFDGDHGTTSVGGPTVRQGLELANYFAATKYLTFDADLATASARSLTDPDNEGTGVPESLNGVISAGATVDTPHYAASLRLRYFGPRQLDTSGDAISPPSTALNTQLTAKFSRSMRVSLDVFNLLNADVPDVTYYYGSWLPYDTHKASNLTNPAINPLLGGDGVNDFHFHPSQARTIRLTLSFGGGAAPGGPSDL